MSDSFSLDADKSELENSIALYEQLKTLNETQASDERLWCYMTHVLCWDYMRARWAIEKARRPISRVTSRYFLRTLNLQTLTRNGISRLWWFAHLTHDASKPNPYELTETLLSKADLTSGIVERAFVSNKNIRDGLLIFLKDNPEIATTEDKWRQLFVGLNLVGGVKILPFLNVDEIMSILSKLKTAIFPLAPRVQEDF